MDNGAGSYHRFLQGDKSGLEELVVQYNRPLIFFINKLVNNIAVSEDIAADTFVELIAGKSRFQEGASFKTWLFRVARNNTIDYLRRQSRYTMRSLEESEAELSDSVALESALIQTEQKKQLCQAMQNIPRAYSEVLHLLYFEEMSYDEAAKVLHKSNRQIKNLAYRGKKALKSKLEKGGFVYEDG